MEVTCPKCRVKLRIPDEKVSQEGSRFKCPKCGAVLLVKKPVKKIQGLDKNKVLLAIAESKVTDEMKSILEGAGFSVITSSDGVDAMVTSVREQPYTAILDVALPKIYGFEVCKRLKSREETKEIKVILYTSFYDRNKYKREPTSLYGADDYIEGFELQSSLLKKVQAITTGGLIDAAEPSLQKKSQPVPVTTPGSGSGGAVDTGDWEKKARRLARTVMADIFLYNPQKAEDALKSGNFLSVFASEVKEGRKLYESRIPKNFRDQKDYFHQEINAFLEEKKNQLE
ncbi:MAG: response regulator [bacterium]